MGRGRRPWGLCRVVHRLALDQELVTVGSLRIGLHRSEGWISKAIKWQTRSDYSHASLVLPDDTVLESIQGRGVVHGRKVESCVECVDLFAVKALTRVHNDALAFAISQLGKPYDYTMVARFVTRRTESTRTKEKWFCSELVFAAFLHAGLPLLRDTQPWEVSPELLSKSPYLVEAGTNRTLTRAAA
jgi:uncharacterized protein YycO